MNTLNIYKPKGQTPLQVIHRLQEKDPALKNKKIAYAGRLDPLAHGVLVLLIEEETKQREVYQNLSKTYIFSAALGCSTDTYDLLGITKQSLQKPPDNFKSKIQDFITGKKGKHAQSYPPFSSKTVQGKPLFWWARSEKLSEIQVPAKEIEIYDFTLQNIDTISFFELRSLVHHVIPVVVGDFRQDKVLSSWEKLYKKFPDTVFPLITFQVVCSSGTYIRSLVHELGIFLGCGAVTLDLLRTKVGPYELEKSRRI